MTKVYRESLVSVCLRLALFWWVVLTIVAFANRPEIIADAASLGDMVYERLWYIGSVSAIFAAGAGVYKLLSHQMRESDLRGRKALGLSASIGAVPVPTEPPPRVSSVDRRLPIWDLALVRWLLAHRVPFDEIVPRACTVAGGAYSKAEASDNEGRREALLAALADPAGRASTITALPGSDEEPSVHARLFMALWDTYCAHRHYPASHREGGHGARRLHVHCLDVAGRCVQLMTDEATRWTFDGIYVKRRGRNPVRFMENHAKYQLRADDPLLPIVGLAHDIGKLLAYEVDGRGRIRKNREPKGNTLVDDDRGIIHDVLGPRILARLPEYWALPVRDRGALTMAVCHYHHPSKFPIDLRGMIDDVRSAALMMLLITADRAVSAEEAGVDVQERAAQEFSSEEVEALYETFVSIVTAHGRINGVGKPAEDAEYRIGQKHADFIAIKMASLMALIRQELGISLDSGANKHVYTNQLLTILKERNLLYTVHNGVDFGDVSPLYRLSLYHHVTTKHLVDLAPALLIKIPPPELEEFHSLTHLALNPCNVVVKNLILSHIPPGKIKGAEELRSRIERAFGLDEANSDVHAEVEESSNESPTIGGSETALLRSGKGEAETNDNSASAALPSRPQAPQVVLKAVSRLDKGMLEAAAKRLARKTQPRLGEEAATRQQDVAELADAPDMADLAGWDLDASPPSLRVRGKHRQMDDTGKTNVVSATAKGMQIVAEQTEAAAGQSEMLEAAACSVEDEGTEDRMTLDARVTDEPDVLESADIPKHALLAEQDDDVRVSQDDEASRHRRGHVEPPDLSDEVLGFGESSLGTLESATSSGAKEVRPKSRIARQSPTKNPVVVKGGDKF